VCHITLPFCKQLHQFAALNRKGKSDGIAEQDDVVGIMDNVIHAHNSMNEMTWNRVAQWESMHPETASQVKLNRFVGRPHDLSPLARLRTICGFRAPFDRHDWYIMRDGEREVRYVIDFYFDEEHAGRPEVRYAFTSGMLC
jgi:cytochrome c heme-lyase